MPEQEKTFAAGGAPWLSGTRGVSLIGGKTSAALVACAMVALADRLGAWWIWKQWAHVPAGIWLVAVAIGGAHICTVRREQIAAITEFDVSGWILRALGWVCSMVPEGWARETWSAARSMAARPGAVERATTVCASRAKGTVLRIGHSESIAPEALAAHRLGELAPGVLAQWRTVSAEGDARHHCTRHGLDALVMRSQDGSVSIVTPDHPSRPAAWSDWGRRLPVGYATVFPARIDAACVPVGRGELDTRSARLVVRATESAAVLARCEARLSMTGRWRGHAVLPGVSSAQGPVAQCMKRLSAALAEWSGTENDGFELRRPAARVAQAWLTTWDGDMDPEFRLRAQVACASVLEDEPESMLRVAAAHFAAYSDEEGMRQVVAAFEQLRAMPPEQTSDPLGFLLAEIELGSPGALTTGRIAAGLGMVWAVAGEENLQYLRDDLMEDMRYAARFVGQDQDLLMIRELMERLERMRTGCGQRRSAA